ncbi:MAG: hypothetical protein AAB074_05420 [Planctomycetota bacterium]
MKRRLLWAFAALAGCGPVRYENDPVPVAETAWVTLPEIQATHPEIDKAVLAARIRTAASEAVALEGLTLAPDEASADLVLEAVVEQFWLGDDAVRILGWKAVRSGVASPEHRMLVKIRARGQPENSATLADAIETGGFARDNVEARRTDALVDRIARSIREIARDYRKR